MPQPSPCDAGYTECITWAQTTEEYDACNAFYYVCTGNGLPEPDPCEPCYQGYSDCLNGAQVEEDWYVCDENYQACLNTCWASVLARLI